MDSLDVEGICKYASKTRTGAIMAIVEVWENILNSLMKSFELGVRHLCLDLEGEREERSKYQGLGRVKLCSITFHTDV